MKVKILFLIVTVLFLQNVLAQEKLDTNAVENCKNAISYKLILEYGSSTGIERHYDKSQYSEAIITSYSGWVLSLTAINNIAFNDRYLLGIGGGLEYRSFMIAIPMELSGMCFLNFRYYFSNSKRTVTPMLNIAVGGRMAKEFDGWLLTDNPWRLSEETMYGVYSTLGAGFKFKRFSLQSGILFWTKGDNLYGIDAMVKVGLNF